MKNKTYLLRLSEEENNLLSMKSSLLGIKKSALLRQSAFIYWKETSDLSELSNRYQNSNKEDQNLIIGLLFEYYRRIGYPHRNFTYNEMIKEMRKISNSKSPVLDNNHLQINTVGVGLANFFHPHMVKIRCIRNYYKTPYEQYENDVLLKDAIRRWLKLGNKANKSGVRRILRTRNGVRSVVNFKPVIARYFYDNYCPDHGSVLDPCSGFSGRLAGCISINKNIVYHGIDPDGETVAGNAKFAGTFSNFYDGIKEKIWQFGFKFDLGCAEEIMPKLSDESYDLIFTSPPYFDVEKYSSNPDQSYKKFNTYEIWRDGFLKPLVQNSARLVNSQGYVILNVKNYERMKIADDVLSFASSFGLKLHKTYHMRLSNNEFNRREGELKFHTEPIFVFSKLEIQSSG